MKAKGNGSVERPHLSQHNNRQSKYMYMDICSINKTEKRNTKDHVMHHLLRQKLLFLILIKEYLLFRCCSHFKQSSSAKQLLKFMHIFTIL